MMLIVGFSMLYGIDNDLLNARWDKVIIRLIGFVALIIWLYRR